MRLWNLGLSHERNPNSALRGKSQTFCTVLQNKFGSVRLDDYAPYKFAPSKNALTKEEFVQKAVE